MITCLADPLVGRLSVPLGCLHMVRRETAVSIVQLRKAVLRHCVSLHCRHANPARCRFFVLFYPFACQMHKSQLIICFRVVPFGSSAEPEGCRRIIARHPAPFTEDPADVSHRGRITVDGRAVNYPGRFRQSGEHAAGLLIHAFGQRRPRFQQGCAGQCQHGQCRCAGCFESEMREHLLLFLLVSR